MSLAGSRLPIALGLSLGLAVSSALVPAASAAPAASDQAFSAAPAPASPAAPAAAAAPAAPTADSPWPGHPAIVAAASVGDGSGSGRVWLELASGERAVVPVPPRARIAAAEVLAGGWVAAGTEPAREGSEILLLANVGGKVTELPPPPRQGGGLRREPLPLVEGGRLAGLVWLEGSTLRTLAVRYASWDGSGWQDEQLISAPGPGSQLALTAARLADGSWLLAWSAFDGEADQIVWSARRGRIWTRPQPLVAHPARSPREPQARQAPNVTPDLAPLPASQGGGALIAWSRLAGPAGEPAYRVMTARFVDGRWQEPELVGPPGSLYPSFVAAPARLRMLYRTAAPGGWTLLDLAPGGRPVKAASLGNPQDGEATERGRPVPTAGAGGVLFRWPAAGGEHFAPWTPWEPVQ
jgi:hypothetical protein